MQGKNEDCHVQFFLFRFYEKISQSLKTRIQLNVAEVIIQITNYLARFLVND